MSIVLKLTAKRGKPPRRGIDFYWSVIQGFAATGQTFTSHDILAVSHAKHNDILDFLKRLAKAGLIEITGTAVYSAALSNLPVYRALVRQSATPKVRRDGKLVEGASKNKAIWNTMRSPVCQLGFTAQDIVAYGTTDVTALNRASVLTYIQMLSRAGYLIAIDKGSPGKLATWRLAPDMNTGPLPPMILRAKVVFDQNRHEIVGDDVEAEEVRL